MPPPAVAKPILLACTSLFWISHYSYVPILPPYAKHQGVSASAWVAFTVLFASYYPLGQTARAMGVITFCNGLSIITGSFLGEVHAETFG